MRTSSVLVFVAALAACAPTTYDTSISTKPADSTATTLPTGTPKELLARMVTVASGLSDLIGSHGKRGEAMTEIDALWAVAKPQFSADQTDLVKTLDAEVALCRIAVERNRPADADKCYRNFLAISDSLPTI